MEPKIRNPNYTNAEDWYKRTIGKYENVPIKIKGYKPVDIGDALREIVQILIARTVVGNKTVNLNEEWFDLDNTNAFKSAIEEKGRDVRNTRLMAARMGLPHGPESIVSSFVSGIDSKNAAQQNDMLRKKIDRSYVPPDRKRMSGGKTRRGRKNRRRTTRKR